MVTQVGTTFLVGDTDGEHLTPSGSRGAGKSFSEDGMCGLHLDGRVGICEAGVGPGGAFSLHVSRSGISKSCWGHAPATPPHSQLPHYTNPLKVSFLFSCPSSFTPSLTHPRPWLHNKCTVQMCYYYYLFIENFTLCWRIVDLQCGVSFRCIAK